MCEQKDQRQKQIFKHRGKFRFKKSKKQKPANKKIFTQFKNNRREKSRGIFSKNKSYNEWYFHIFQAWM